jgi:hypothetical protein
VKVSWNHEITALKGIGKKKLQQLMDAGINTVRELVEYPGVPQPWIGSNDSSKMFEKALFVSREKAVRSLEKDATELKEQLLVAEGNVQLEESVHGQMELKGDVKVEDPLPAPFSSL